MNSQQFFKSLKVSLVMVFIMLVFEVAFAFNSVSDWVASLVDMKNSEGYVYAVVWVVMFIQVCLIPIPAYIPLNAALHAKIVDPSLGLWGMLGQGRTWIFMAVVLCAYMAGAVVAYFLGFFFGSKAVKWVAGSDEDYRKWSSLISEKGKLYYFITVLLPVFPDDLLCLVVGSMRFDFLWFFLSNLIGRAIGLILMVGGLALIQSTSRSFPFSALAWGIIFLLLLVFTIVYYFTRIRNKPIK